LFGKVMTVSEMQSGIPQLLLNTYGAKFRRRSYPVEETGLRWGTGSPVGW